MAKLKVEKEFSSVPNELLHNKSLSLKAKGLFSYLQSKPDDWDFSAKRISHESKDGEDGVYAALLELETQGYLTREKSHDTKGHWEIEYTLHTRPQSPSREKPEQGKPEQGKPEQGKPEREKPEIIVKQNIQKQNIQKQNETISPTPKRDSGQELIISERSELEISLEQFEISRKKMRKPMTPYAKALLLKKLSGYTEKEQVSMLEEAIEKGWQSVYHKESLSNNGKNLDRMQAMARYNIT